MEEEEEFRVSSKVGQTTSASSSSSPTSSPGNREKESPTGAAEVVVE